MSTEYPWHGDGVHEWIAKPILFYFIYLGVFLFKRMITKPVSYYEAPACCNKNLLGSREYIPGCPHEMKIR
jgi:hypothetical protein